MNSDNIRLVKGAWSRFWPKKLGAQYIKNHQHESIGINLNDCKLEMLWTGSNKIKLLK